MTGFFSDLSFAEPARLWLLLGVPPAVLLAGRLTLAHLGRRQLVLALLLRAVLLSTLVLALCRPTLADDVDRVCATLAVDVSGSVSPAALERARAFVSRARAAARPGDATHVVTFGGHARRVPDRAPIERHDPTSTDAEAAVRLAGALCDEGLVRRIAVLSDGLETDGDLVSAAAAARAGGARVFAVALSADDAPEALVADLEVVGEVRAGSPFQLRAELRSSVAQRAKVRLLVDGKETPKAPARELDLPAGSTHVTFPVDRADAGRVRVAVRVEAPRAGRPENDEAALLVDVVGPPRVLFVEKGASPSAAFVRALAAEHVLVDLRGPEAIPRSAADLERYDLVVLSDVSAQYLGGAVTRALEQYLQAGGGLLVAGGESSFGPGGYTGTPFEKLLPVRADPEKEKNEPHLALALVIDRSGSMSGEKMEMAKNAALGATELLGPSDLVAVIAFDSVANVVTRLQRAANRLRIASDISKIQATGGTNILPALAEAHQQLSPAHARIKHVILLTDGQAPYQGIGELCDEMSAQGITVSSVGVGREADRTLLAMIAERGGGRFYYTDSAATVPRIFSRETAEVSRSAVREAPVHAVVTKRTEWLAGTDLGSAPAIRGYVVVRPRPIAETLLAATGSPDPLLVRWRVGLGESVVWTSDLGRRFSQSFARWPGYPKLWAQIARGAMRRRVATELPMHVTITRGAADVWIDAVGTDDRFLEGLSGELEVGADGGRPARKVPLQQTAPGRYGAHVPVGDRGPRVFSATLTREGRTVAGARASAFVAPAPEWMARPADTALLARAAARGGGRMLEEPAPLYDPATDRIPRRRELWPLLALGAVALVVLDLAARRITIRRRRRRSSGA